MSMVQDIIVIALLVLSWGFIIFGMVAVFKLKNIYTRILSAATIDSMASLTILIGLLIFGITDYQYIIRFVLLIGFLLITNPISSHVNIRSAYITGFEMEKLNKMEEENKVGDTIGY
jgi:multicomponent Na+:H+ antiporter subunit G